SYAKRWAVEPLFAAMKHGWGLKDAWQRSRQVLMRWVTILAAGYALSQMLAYADPARTPGLASPAPWRPPGTRTAGLIQAGLARVLRGVGPPPRGWPARPSRGFYVGSARPRSCPRSRKNRAFEAAGPTPDGRPPTSKP